MKIAVAGASGLIGTMVVELARSQGHEVLPIGRSTGFDLTDGAVVATLTQALDGVDAVIDVTQGTDFDEEGAVAFFRAVGTNLGDAAREAGVERVVLLSIVGIERGTDYGYYVGKIAHEKAHREHSPNAVVLRATQFHEFAQQSIEWSLERGVAHVMDVEVQPIDSAEVVAALLDLATASDAADLQIAGPQVESLIALSKQVAAASGDDVRIEDEEAPTSMTNGGMLPQVEDGVEIRGRSWAEWFEGRNATA